MQRQCESLKDDPWLIGTFIGNEPPWPGRESELVDMFLNGPDTATKTKLRAYLTQNDTMKRGEHFVHTMFERYLDLINAAIKKYDANHLNLGIRFGGSPPEAVCRLAKKFDVCSINVYEYEPTRQLKRTFALAGRPIVIGEFHFGVPANGLVQAWYRRRINPNGPRVTATMWNRQWLCLTSSEPIGFSGKTNLYWDAWTVRITISAW